MSETLAMSLPQPNLADSRGFNRFAPIDQSAFDIGFEGANL